MASAAGVGASVWRQLDQLNLKARSPTGLCRQPRRKTRRLRRKRSKAKYYAYLKERRYQLKTKSFRAVSILDVTDMECSGGQLSHPLTDVAEWHRVEQVAYWKSRAISLQLENEMLYEHIKNVYAKHVNDYDQSTNEPNRRINVLMNTCESDSRIPEENDAMEDAEKLPPKEQVGEQKQNEMKKLYGEMAPKITGMETAVQLNYNRQISRGKPHYWPNIPLKL